ncbi:aspartate kinase [Brevibacillus dissolubilis]|uniref:aspartate kinase n=1 Tax=Brevibacillus dissolubilis TaxID=1844116 RepID=UPI001116415D|nr:aspartate kinase [Brevibacillus dissolubilis]
MKVAKFGGTSLASAAQIRKVCEIIQADPKRRLIVVSAPGKRFKEDTKVTDLLIALAEQFLAHGEAEAELAAVVARYQEIGEELNLPAEVIAQVTDNLRRLLLLDASNPESFLDSVKAAGEDNNAQVVAAYLQSIGVKASYASPREAGLLVSGEHGNAQLLPESYDRLRSLREREGITIFPGFFGYTPDGTLLTFSRGGSDVTGSILAAAIQAELYENFTDVDSVYAVNPNLIPNPHEIKEMTYREMRELSYGGFTVFHEEALAPAFRAGIPVCVKNTNNPTARGTMILSERSSSEHTLAGISSDKGFCSIYVSKYLMNREIGFGRKLLQILEEEKLSYEHTPSGIDDISVILREPAFTEEIEGRVVKRIWEELDVDQIHVERSLALVMMVGEGMRRSVGVTGRAASALAKAGVNIEMINQGSSEVSLMFGVKAVDADRAVISLYEEFFGNVQVAVAGLMSYGE